MPRNRYKNDGARRLAAAMKEIGRQERGRPLSYEEASKLVHDRSGRRIPRQTLHRYQANSSNGMRPGFANRRALSIALGIPLEAWDWPVGERRQRVAR